MAIAKSAQSKYGYEQGYHPDDPGAYFFFGAFYWQKAEDSEAWASANGQKILEVSKIGKTIRVSFHASENGQKIYVFKRDDETGVVIFKQLDTPSHPSNFPDDSIFAKQSVIGMYWDALVEFMKEHTITPVKQAPGPKEDDWSPVFTEYLPWNFSPTYLATMSTIERRTIVFEGFIYLEYRINYLVGLSGTNQKIALIRRSDEGNWFRLADSTSSWVPMEVHSKKNHYHQVFGEQIEKWLNPSSKQLPNGDPFFGVNSGIAYPTKQVQFTKKPAGKPVHVKAGQTVIVQVHDDVTLYLPDEIHHIIV